MVCRGYLLTLSVKDFCEDFAPISADKPAIPLIVTEPKDDIDALLIADSVIVSGRASRRLQAICQGRAGASAQPLRCNRTMPRRITRLPGRMARTLACSWNTT
jgi:hypothetical protein